MILESIVVTRTPEGDAHIAPLGVHVHDAAPDGSARFVLAPYRPSRTLDHLMSERAASIEWTDDVRLFAGALTGRRDWPTLPGQKLDRCLRLADANTHLEVVVDEIEEDEQRPRFICRVVHQSIQRPFGGFNRAQIAVVEGAILLSRARTLPRERVEEEMKFWQSAIDKTAGEREREAWAWLHDAMAERFPGWSRPNTKLPSAVAIPLVRASAARRPLPGLAPRLLISVRNESEVDAALQGGADVLDLKDPALGALGAVSHETALAILDRVDELRDAMRLSRGLANDELRTSATIGDHPAESGALIAAMNRARDLPVDYLKLGLMPGPGRIDAIRAVGAIAWPFELVAVLFADQEAPQDWLPVIDELVTARFAGIVIDTALKSRGSLTSLRAPEEWGRVVSAIRHRGLFCGLAGSLRLEDVDLLAPMMPDLLGFRGGVCEAHQRVGALSRERVREVAARLDLHRGSQGRLLV